MTGQRFWRSPAAKQDECGCSRSAVMRKELNFAVGRGLEVHQVLILANLGKLDRVMRHVLYTYDHATYVVKRNEFCYLQLTKRWLLRSD
jgi:hypothetical protein